VDRDAHARRLKAEAIESSAWRTLAVVGIWIALEGLGFADPPLISLLLHLGVVVAATWSLRAGEQAAPREFGWRTNWTGMLLVPRVLAAVLALRDIWDLTHSGYPPAG